MTGALGTRNVEPIFKVRKPAKQKQRNDAEVLTDDLPAVNIDTDKPFGIGSIVTLVSLDKESFGLTCQCKIFTFTDRPGLPRELELKSAQGYFSCFLDENRIVHRDGWTAKFTDWDWQEIQAWSATAAQMVDLQSVFISVRDGIGTVADYFEVEQPTEPPAANQPKTGVAAVKAKMNAAQSQTEQKNDDPYANEQLRNEQLEMESAE